MASTVIATVSPLFINCPATGFVILQLGLRLGLSSSFLHPFTNIKEMQDKKLFAPGIVTMINKQSERMFATGGAGVTFNGSWCVNVYEGMNPELKYSAMFYPSISNNFPVVVLGGAGSSFVVSGNSTKTDAAVAFLKWLTNVDNQLILTKETNNLPSNPGAIGQMPDILNEFADDMENTVHPFLLPVMEDPQVDEVIGKGIQSIIIGETTPENLAAKVDSVKKKVLAENA